MLVAPVAPFNSEIVIFCPFQDPPSSLSPLWVVRERGKKRTLIPQVLYIRRRRSFTLHHCHSVHHSRHSSLLPRNFVLYDVARHYLRRYHLRIQKFHDTIQPHGYSIRHNRQPYLLRAQIGFCLTPDIFLVHRHSEHFVELSITIRRRPRFFELGTDFFSRPSCDPVRRVV